jgi:hypothetical protein
MTCEDKKKEENVRFRNVILSEFCMFCRVIFSFLWCLVRIKCFYCVYVQHFRVLFFFCLLFKNDQGDLGGH